MKSIVGTGLVALSLCTVACGRQVTPKHVFKSAINTYYQVHPTCIWDNEKTFPVKASPEDAKSAGYDALVDQGLLTRTAAGRHESTYTVSASGQLFWVSDPHNAGAGNLCYGHQQVVAIDHASDVPSRPGYSSMVSYHYTVAGVPEWASAPEIQAAFPELNADGKPQMGIATLTDTNSGWQVNPPANDAPSPPTSASNEHPAAGRKTATD